MDLPLHNNYSINLQKNIGMQCKRQSMPLNNNYSISLQKNIGMQCKRWSIRGHTYSHACAHASGAGGAHITISCTASLQGSGCFGETNSTKLKSFFLFTFKGHKSNSQEKKKDPFIHTRSYNSGGKAIFSSQRLAGQERGKTAETPVHLEDHNLNSRALLTTVPSLDFESRTIKSST